MDNMKHIFSVTGMSCEHCARAITQAIRAVDPEAQVQVFINDRRVEVESDQARAILAEAIRDEGYTVLD